MLVHSPRTFRSAQLLFIALFLCALIFSAGQTADAGFAQKVLNLILVSSGRGHQSRAKAQRRKENLKNAAALCAFARDLFHRIKHFCAKPPTLVLAVRGQPYSIHLSLEQLHFGYPKVGKVQQVVCLVRKLRWREDVWSERVQGSRRQLSVHAGERPFSIALM
jgi:hypothetical protein